MDIFIQFDGTYNPIRESYYGFIIYEIRMKDKKTIHVEGGKLESVSNSFEAAWASLEKALQFVERNIANVEYLTIIGNEELVIHQMTKEWACNKPSLLKYRDRCAELAYRITNKWTAHWVPENKIRDAKQLAKDAYLEDYKPLLN